MPVEERTRRMMGESLMRIHGEEVADAIMAHLPPVTYSELATKQDLREAVAELRVEMHKGFADLHRSNNRIAWGVVLGILSSPVVASVVERLL